MKFQVQNVVFDHFESTWEIRVSYIHTDNFTINCNVFEGFFSHEKKNNKQNAAFSLKRLSLVECINIKYSIHYNSDSLKKTVAALTKYMAKFWISFKVISGGGGMGGMQHTQNIWLPFWLKKWRGCSDYEQWLCFGCFKVKCWR